jgi:hypothetical protein
MVVQSRDGQVRQTLLNRFNITGMCFGFGIECKPGIGKGLFF